MSVDTYIGQSDQIARDSHQYIIPSEALKMMKSVSVHLDIGHITLKTVDIADFLRYTLDTVSFG